MLLQTFSAGHCKAVIGEQKLETVKEAAKKHQYCIYEVLLSEEAFGEVVNLREENIVILQSVRIIVKKQGWSPADILVGI